MFCPLLKRLVCFNLMIIQIMMEMSYSLSLRNVDEVSYGTSILHNDYYSCKAFNYLLFADSQGVSKG